jgi:tetratricopeptide (TPR) repeat protein
MDAATLYLEVGEARATQGRAEAAAQAWTLAGDALRRDDRPASAARALTRAVSLQDDVGIVAGDARSALLSELAGVLRDAGHLTAAIRHAEEAAQVADGNRARALALDVLIGLRLERGENQAAASALERLAQVCRADLAFVVSFRAAQLHRQRGQLSEAKTLLRQVHSRISDRAGTQGLLGAVCHAVADLALLQGETDVAWTWFRQAGDAWQLAGRRAGIFRAQAGLVRVSLSEGASPLAADLNAPMDHAVERGLLLLETELRIVRGAAWSVHGLARGAWELERAIRLAREAGAVLLEGRARLMRGLVGLAEEEDLTQGPLCLAGDACLTRWLLERPAGLTPW